MKRTLHLGFLFLGGAALLVAGSLSLAMAQVNCETFPAGPARTNCYIGLSGINRHKFEISAVLLSTKPRPKYRKVTGKRANNNQRRLGERKAIGTMA